MNDFMKNFRYTFALLLAVFTLSVCRGHSTGETNQLVRTLLIRAITTSPSDRINAGGVSSSNVVRITTWQRFLPDNVGESWSFEEKKNAFDWYLSTLGTNDLSSIEGMDLAILQKAIFLCRQLSYTNSVPHLRGLALNPRGREREAAIEQVLEMGALDDSMTDFVESMVTNVLHYSEEERETAFEYFHKRLVAPEAPLSVRDRAVQMLFRHRRLSLAGDVASDCVFSTLITGYEMSSNRLAEACFVLTHPDCSDAERDYFSDVTNRLLSSGQPLRQLPIGEGRNE